MNLQQLFVKLRTVIKVYNTKEFIDFKKSLEDLAAKSLIAVCKTILWSKWNSNRHTANLAAVIIAPYLKGTSYGTNFYKSLVLFNKVPIDIFDDMVQIIDTYAYFNKTEQGKISLPCSMRKGFTSAIENINSIEPFIFDRASTKNIAALIHPSPNKCVKVILDEESASALDIVMKDIPYEASFDKQNIHWSEYSNSDYQDCINAIMTFPL